MFKAVSDLHEFGSKERVNDCAKENQGPHEIKWLGLDPVNELRPAAHPPPSLVFPTHRRNRPDCCPTGGLWPWAQMQDKRPQISPPQSPRRTTSPCSGETVVGSVGPLLPQCLSAH